MSATNCACPCPDPTVTEIPGAAGATGADGADGTNGVNAFTTLTTGFNLPGAPGVAGLQAFGVTSWMSENQVIIISDPNGTDYAHFQVNSIPNSTQANLTWLDYPGDAVLGTPLAALSTVSPAGILPVFSPPADLTDSTGAAATAGTTLQAGVGVYVLPVSLQLSDLTNNIIAVITPGHAFRILKVDWANNKAGGAAGAATITPTVSNGTLAGGVITLGGTTTVGAVTAGTAVTQTFANASTSVASLTLTASGVTTYTSGDGSILVYIQNVDTIHAIAALNTSVNAINATL